MNFGADLAGHLVELRNLAASRMRTQCRIERPGRPVTDSAGDVTISAQQVYEGKCRLRYPGMAFEHNMATVGAIQVASRVVVRVPFGVEFQPGDRITILSDPDTPHLAGMTLRVASIDDQSQAVDQRLLCEDVQNGPSGDAA